MDGLIFLVWGHVTKKENMAERDDKRETDTYREVGERYVAIDCCAWPSCRRSLPFTAVAAELWSFLQETLDPQVPALEERNQGMHRGANQWMTAELPLTMAMKESISAAPLSLWSEGERERECEMNWGVLRVWEEQGWIKDLPWGPVVLILFVDDKLAAVNHRPTLIRTLFPPTAASLPI